MGNCAGKSGSSKDKKQLNGKETHIKEEDEQKAIIEAIPEVAEISPVTIVTSEEQFNEIIKSNLVVSFFLNNNSNGIFSKIHYLKDKLRVLYHLHNKETNDYSFYDELAQSWSTKGVEFIRVNAGLDLKNAGFETAALTLPLFSVNICFFSFFEIHLYNVCF